MDEIYYINTLITSLNEAVKNNKIDECIKIHKELSKVDTTKIQSQQAYSTTNINDLNLEIKNYITQVIENKPSGVVLDESTLTKTGGKIEVKDGGITTVKLDTTEKSTTIYTTLRGGIVNTYDNLKKLYDYILATFLKKTDKAIGTEITTGTNDTKYITAKGVNDSDIVKSSKLVKESENLTGANDSDTKALSVKSVLKLFKDFALKTVHVDDTTIAVNASDKIEVKDGGITETKLDTTEKSTTIYTTLRGGVATAYDNLKKLYDYVLATFLKKTDKASSSEITTGTNDTKYVTPKGLNDSDIIKSSKLVKERVNVTNQNATDTQALSTRSILKLLNNFTLKTAHVDDTTINVNSSNKIEVKDGGITTAKLDTSEKSTTIYTTLRGGVATAYDNLKKLYDYVLATFLKKSDKASSGEITTATNNTKYVTPKGLIDARIFTTADNLGKLDNPISGKAIIPALEVVVITSAKSSKYTLENFKTYTLKMTTSRNNRVIVLPTTVVDGDWIILNFAEWNGTDPWVIEGSVNLSTNPSLSKRDYEGVRLKIYYSSSDRTWLVEKLDYYRQKRH